MNEREIEFNLPVYPRAQLMREAADFLDENPERYSFMAIYNPIDPRAERGCVLGWIAAMAGVRMWEVDNPELTPEDDPVELPAPLVAAKLLGLKESEFYRLMGDAQNALRLHGDWHDDAVTAAKCVRHLANLLMRYGAWDDLLTTGVPS